MKKFLLFSLIALCTISCDKDDDNGETNLAVTKDNIVGAYTIASITYKVGVAPEYDVTNSVLQTCEKDDVITLNSDNTLNSVDAGVQCSPPNNYTGTWSLSGNTITIDASVLIEGTVTKLTNKSAQVQDTDNSTGTTVVTTFNLNRQ